MLGRVREVLVCGEQDQIVPDGKLRKQRIDGADLHTRLPTRSSQRRSADMIIPIRLEQRQCGEALDDLSLRFGSREALQQLLKHEPGGYYDVRSEQSFFELLHFWFSGVDISTQCQRPDAGINEQRHL